MKNNSLLLLSIITVLVTSASAARNEATSTAVTLPTYVVEAGRSSPAEQSVQRSLSALRELARTPVVVSVDLPALKAPVAYDGKALAGTRVAKF
jgi:hypothetical protein